jgi:hypothetical protein
MKEATGLKLTLFSRGGVRRRFTGTAMKTGVLACVVLAAHAVTLPAFAGEAGWSKSVTVMELTPTDQRRYEFRLKLTENPAGCKNPDTFYQDYDSVGADKMYHLLLQALSTEKKVRVHVTGRCELNGYAEISAVSMMR